MHKLANMAIALALVAILLVTNGFFFVVDETKQVVVTQFGEPIGRPITKAGLYFKIPVIQVANYFDKQILQWNGDPNQMTTREKRYIWVDTTARWRIVDALKFMQSVGTEENAQTRLDDIVDAVTRDAVSNANLVEAVRNTNRLLDQVVTHDLNVESSIGEADNSALERVTLGRDALTREILQNASKIMPSYGIELLDVRIKRISYVQEVRKKVFDRMISERKRAAEQFRSEGQGAKAGIEGQMVKELRDIESTAYRKAQEIKGNADAEAIKIYADAYNLDPEFYSFTKTLETYRGTVNASTTLMLTTDSDYFEYLKNIKSKTPSP